MRTSAAVARGCDRAGVVGAGSLGRAKWPARCLLVAASCGRLTRHRPFRPPLLIRVLDRP